jgi:hypothetical protein
MLLPPFGQSEYAPPWMAFSGIKTGQFFFSIMIRVQAFHDVMI